MVLDKVISSEREMVAELYLAMGCEIKYFQFPAVKLVVNSQKEKDPVLQRKTESASEFLERII